MRHRLLLSTAFIIPLIFISFASAQNFIFQGDDDLGIEEEAPVIKVILDPGHGGHDLGTRSPKHILEKNIILKLSKLIQQGLSNNEIIETIIARPEDMYITVLNRIKFANASRGDLFIGLHADGGMGPRSHAIKIYISRYEKEEQIPNSQDRSNALDSHDDRHSHNAWELLNYPFQKQNQALAESIKKQMGKIGAGRDIEIKLSDKLMLGGLSMPAVLIEPIDLSNPADEIRLENEVYITKIADAIAIAVEMYLKDAGKL